MKLLLIYTTHSSQEAAENLCRPLLQDSIIACVNYIPMTSSYSWKGEIVTASEIIAVLKTRVENWEQVKDYIGQKHPYETPCIIKLGEVEANESFSNWIQVETET